jgi:hypothetical protein
MDVLTTTLALGLYLALLWTAGVATFRRGHYGLFFAGVVIPVAWVVGVLIRPTPEVVAARAARVRSEGEQAA